MRLALIGFGNIGRGVEEIVYKRRKMIKDRFGLDISIEAVLVKDITKKRNPKDKNIVFTDKFEDILSGDIDAFVEVTATIDEAFYYLTEGLKHGKDIITSNKAVVSAHFEELSELAFEKNCAFLYESSVGGAVHIIKSILEDSHLNEIKYVRGILNGTCNYILSAVEDNGSDYFEVLKEAQELGYAEPDPTADVDGIDTKRKTRIISSLAMQGKVEESMIHTFGISNITTDDIKMFKNKNYQVKLIGEGLSAENGYFSTAMPALCPNSSVFAHIKGSTNCISYYGDNVGELKFIGAGAGSLPTGDAILRDIVDAGLKTYIPGNPLGNRVIEIKNEEMLAEFYLRIPKERVDLFQNLSREIIYFSDEVCIYTKEIPFKLILRAINGLEKNEYFLAKIMREEK